MYPVRIPELETSPESNSFPIDGLSRDVASSSASEVSQQPPLSSRTKGSGAETSSLLQAFGAVKVHDYLGNQNADKVERMKHGMEELLDIQSPDELRALCGALGIKIALEYTHGESKAKVLLYIRDHGKGLVMDYIRNRGDYKERAFSEVLGLMWEGIVFEYLRVKGLPIRECSDPRKATIKLWLEGSKEAQAFTPMYIQRKTRLRECLDLSYDMRTILEPIEQNELIVKKVEARMRIEKDHRNVSLYLNAVTALRAMEREARKYLTDEILTLRARHEHDREVVSLCTRQILELEDRYQVVRDDAAFHVVAEEEVGRSFMHLWSNQVSMDQYLKRFVLNLLHEKLPKIAKVVDSEVQAVEEVDYNSPELEAKPTEVLIELFKQKNQKLNMKMSSANKKIKQALTETQAELDKTKKALEVERKRAEEAEKERDLLKEKFEELSDMHVDMYGTLKTESDMYMALASDHMTTAWMHERRLEAAKANLLTPMLKRQDKPELVSVAAQVLEMLGLATRTSILEECERGHMAQEEVRTRHVETMQLVRKAMLLEEKKAAKAGKGRGGKGGAKKPAASKKK